VLAQAKRRFVSSAIARIFAMTWQTVREHFPNSWVLVEATQSESKDGFWHIHDMAVLQSFEVTTTALDAYEKLPKKVKQKDVAVFHTSHDKLEIPETFWFGIRSGA
jgi:hypothetical protein